MLEQAKANEAMRRLSEALAGTYVGRDALEPLLEDYRKLRAMATYPTVGCMCCAHRNLDCKDGELLQCGNRDTLLEAQQYRR